MAEIRYFEVGTDIETLQARLYADNVDIHEGELDGSTFNPPHRLRPCLRFQWQKSINNDGNYVDIPGAIQDQYDITNSATVEQSGAYRCRMDLGTSYTENGAATDDGCEIRYTEPFVVAIIDCTTSQVTAHNTTPGVVEQFTDTILERGVIVHHPPFASPSRDVVEADWAEVTSRARDCVMTPADGLNTEVDCTGYTLTAEMTTMGRRGRFRVIFGNDDYECVFAISQIPAPAVITAPPAEDDLSPNRRPTCTVVNNGPVTVGTELIWRATATDADGDTTGTEWYLGNTFIGVHPGGNIPLLNSALTGGPGGTTYTNSRGDAITVDSSTAGSVGGDGFRIIDRNQLALSVAGESGQSVPELDGIYLQRSVTQNTDTLSFGGNYSFNRNAGTFSGPAEDFVTANGSRTPTAATNAINWAGIATPVRFTNSSGDRVVVNSFGNGSYSRVNGTGRWSFPNANVNYGDTILARGNGLLGGGWTGGPNDFGDDITRTITVASVDYEDGAEINEGGTAIKSSTECTSVGTWSADPGESQFGTIDGYQVPVLDAGDTNSRAFPNWRIATFSNGGSTSGRNFSDVWLNQANGYLISIGQTNTSENGRRRLGHRLPDVGDRIRVVRNSDLMVIDERSISSILPPLNAGASPPAFTAFAPSVGGGWSFRVAGGDQTWRNNARQAIPFGNQPNPSQTLTHHLSLVGLESPENEYRFTVNDAFVQMAFYLGNTGDQFNPTQPRIDATCHITGPTVQSTNGQDYQAGSTTKSIRLQVGSASDGAVRQADVNGHNPSVIYDTNALVRFRLGPGQYSVYFTSEDPFPSGISQLCGLYYEVIGGTGVNGESRALNNILL